MLTTEEQAIIDNLTPAEKRELDLAKRLLVALVYGPVRNLGGLFYGVGQINLWFDQTDMHDAVRCLQRLGYRIDRSDSGGSPTWNCLWKE